MRRTRTASPGGLTAGHRSRWAMNMKRITKAALLILAGFVLCYGLMMGLSLHRAIRSSKMPQAPSDNSPTKQEVGARRNVLELFRRGDVGGLNRILRVEAGDVEIRINGPDSFPVSHTPLAEVIISNQSKRDVTFFHPEITRLTVTSSDYQGYIRDEFSMGCPVTLNSQCHVLGPRQSLSVPVPFRVTGVGKHKINLSAGFPVYEEMSSDSSSLSAPVVARAQYVFSVVEEPTDGNAQHATGN